MRRKLLLLLAATVVTVVAVGAVVLLRDPEPETGGGPAPAAEPEYSPTPLADVDTTALVVVRDAFCERVSQDAVKEALGREPVDAAGYGNGERAVLGDGTADVAHEFGCVWSAGEVEARAWVFAPPVSPADAQALAKAAVRTPRCSPIRGAAPFGSPTAALVCGAADSPVASYRGLFGDAWLACSVTGGTREQAAERADTWCAAVALAASSATD